MPQLTKKSFIKRMHQPRLAYVLATIAHERGHRPRSASLFVGACDNFRYDFGKIVCPRQRSPTKNLRMRPIAERLPRARSRWSFWSMKLVASTVLAFAAANLAAAQPATPARSGNPILPGWYADPEAHVFDGRYWIFPTYSAPYDQQTFLDAFSSRDLVTWEKHPRVLDIADVSWAKRAVWAPSIVEKDGWYYLFFGANDIQNDQQLGGIGVARARSPSGPFKDYLGKPLIDRFHNGAQPIDQMVFKDRDGSYYIVYGGWRHCNIAKLNPDFNGFVPFPDGSTFREITPAGYVEGAFMLVKDDRYYFMWSEGGWTGPNYAVAYAVGSSPFGPFERVGKILQQDSTVATGAGHHSVLRSPSGKWYIVYHRRPLGETDRNHRVVSIDELRFDERGLIQQVKITREGVAADRIP
jgi:beta-xylosidase